METNHSYGRRCCAPSSCGRRTDVLKKCFQQELQKARSFRKAVSRLYILQQTNMSVKELSIQLR